MENRRYGWNKDALDKRDFLLGDILPEIELPPSVDLRDKCPAIVDQGQLGSCTANALAGAIGFIHPELAASRLFIYYNERLIEHTVKSDSGAQIRDGIKTLTKNGVCEETIWPYDIANFADRPSIEAYTCAKTDVIKTYHKIIGLSQMKACLAQGFPFVFGFTVYDAFESADVAHLGIVPMPSPADQPVGGHAVMAVGYNDNMQMVLVRNSWGTSWGLEGHFWMPYQYIADAQLANDFWTIRG